MDSMSCSFQSALILTSFSSCCPSLISISRALAAAHGPPMLVLTAAAAEDMDDSQRPFLVRLRGLRGCVGPPYDAFKCQTLVHMVCFLVLRHQCLLSSGVAKALKSGIGQTRREDSCAELEQCGENSMPSSHTMLSVWIAVFWTLHFQSMDVSVRSMPKGLEAIPGH